MKVELKTIWPLEAKEILETKNVNNRALSSITVQKLANDIKNKSFLLTHQGIAFDESGRLIDGQHRLAACVMANLPITILVTVGLPASQNIGSGSLNTFEVLDSGKNRNVGQMLFLSGIKDANKVAACAKAVGLICCKSDHNFGISIAQTHKILNIMGESISTCVEIGKNGSILKTPAYITGPFAIYHNSFPDKSIKMLNEFVNVSQPADSLAPSRALAKFHQNNPSVAGGQQHIERYKFVCFAIHKFHLGENITRMTSSDASMDWLIKLDAKTCKKVKNVIISD